MQTQAVNPNEYRDLPLSMLSESTTNPRRHFDEGSLKEFADYVPRHINPRYVPLPLLWPRQRLTACLERVQVLKGT
jgi:hypothetical protein